MNIPPLPGRPALLPSPDPSRVITLRRLATVHIKLTPHGEGFVSYRYVRMRRAQVLRTEEVAKLARNIWKDVFGFDFPY